MLLFRQEQQTARRALEKQREAWDAEQLRRLKEADAMRKEDLESERRTKKAKANMEAKIAAQDSIQRKELEKNAVRCVTHNSAHTSVRSP